MTGITTYLTIENFTQKGLFSDSGLSTIDNVVFRKGNTFADFEIKKVLDTCNKYNNFGVDTLIVKKDNELTIWIAEFSASDKPSDSHEDLNHPASTQPQIDRSLPTKTVVKRYRGREYEETVVDYAALQQLQTNQLKPRRKYRGQYID